MRRGNNGRDITDLLEQIFNAEQSTPPPDIDWHRATVSSLELDGLGKIFTDDVKLGDTVYVGMGCQHEQVGLNPVTRQAKMLTTRHAWTGKSFEDLPVDLVTVHEKAVYFECAVCDRPTFVTEEERKAMQDRPEFPGPRKSEDTCQDCWSAVEPLAGNETMIEIAKQFREHFHRCRPCQLLPVPCREGKRLLDLVDTVRFGDRTFTGIMADLRAKSPAFQEQVEQVAERASLEFVMAMLARAL